MWKEHFRRAISLVGSQEKLAKEMGCSQAKISWLLVTADVISAEDSMAVDRATGGRVSAAALRPDLWRQPADVPAEARA